MVQAYGNYTVKEDTSEVYVITTITDVAYYDLHILLYKTAWAKTSYKVQLS